MVSISLEHKILAFVVVATLFGLNIISFVLFVYELLRRDSLLNSEHQFCPKYACKTQVDTECKNMASRKENTKVVCQTNQLATYNDDETHPS